MKCNKKIFVKILNKFVSCRKSKNHKYTCRPDLRNEKIGNHHIIKSGNKNKWSQRTWVAYTNGKRVTVLEYNLLSGRSRDIKVKHGFCRRNRKQPEYNTVAGHFHKILVKKIRCYIGMPFYNEWNPLKGGAFWKGAEWIINKLGHKPGPTWSLDIIEHDKGFVPGNLRWANKSQQRLNQRHRILGRFSLQELRIEAKRHGYKLVRL